MTRQKRPDRLLELARVCPDYHFDLVGPADESEYARDVLATAPARAEFNVVHGRAEREQTARACTNESACFLCTSDFEGFPNTFLEAWSHGYADRIDLRSGRNHRPRRAGNRRRRIRPAPCDRIARTC